MSKAWDIVEGLIRDEEKVDEILSEELKTTLAKARAEAEAYAKFGE